MSDKLIPAYFNFAYSKGEAITWEHSGVRNSTAASRPTRSCATFYRSKLGITSLTNDCCNSLTKGGSLVWRCIRHATALRYHWKRDLVMGVEGYAVVK